MSIIYFLLLILDLGICLVVVDFISLVPCSCIDGFRTP
jgi:hypothetical protein